MSKYQSLIREYLKAPGNSQNGLAAKVGCTQATISRYASGRMPDRETAESLHSASGGEIALSVWQEEMARSIGIDLPEIATQQDAA